MTRKKLEKVGQEKTRQENYATWLGRQVHKYMESSRQTDAIEKTDQVHWKDETDWTHEEIR